MGPSAAAAFKRRRERAHQGEQEAGRGGQAQNAPAGPSEGEQTEDPGARIEHPANESVRRAVAGAPGESEAHPVESPELSALREADRQLFPESGAPVGLPWTTEWPTLDPSPPKLRASGLPPSRTLPEASRGASGRDVSWLAALAMPELPVRWDARVVRYLEYYRDDPRGRNLVQAWVKKSGRYGGTMRRVLRELGLPEISIWVSLVESGFEPAIRSPAGAAGLWQLMPEGARVYGLVVDRWIDERLDPERSTLAAARYLADLHRRFGSGSSRSRPTTWDTAGSCRRFASTTPTTIWELSRCESGIPFETALYVPKIIAMAVVAKNLAPFGVDAMKVDPPLAYDRVDVPAGTTVKAIASAAAVDASVIEGLNPQLRAGRTPPEGPSSDTRFLDGSGPGGQGNASESGAPRTRRARSPARALPDQTRRFGRVDRAARGAPAKRGCSS